MPPRRIFDPTLFDRADRSQQGATAFLERGKTVLAKTSIQVSDRAMEDAAQSEARRAADSGLGSLTLTATELTPGMSRLSSNITNQYSTWKGDLDRQKSALGSVLTDIEREIDELENADIPELRLDKSVAVSRAEHDLEESKPYVQNREQYNVEKG